MTNPRNREKILEIIRRNRKLEKQYREVQAVEPEVHQSDKFDNWSTDPEDIDYLIRVGMEQI